MKGCSFLLSVLFNNKYNRMKLYLTLEDEHGAKVERVIKIDENTDFEEIGITIEDMYTNFNKEF
jgi:hypothetical protein